jgi:hypothetical protein
MKSSLVLIILFTSLLMFIGCSPKLMPEGHYQDTQIVIDGNIEDWGLPLRFSNPEYSMQYSVTNDARNIYVCVYTKDQTFQRRILKAGMSISFDPKGEKEKKMSLVFPVKKPDDPSNTNNNGNLIRYSDVKTTLEELLLKSDYYNTIGFINFENGQFDIGFQKNNIQVAIKINDDSSLVYEAAIPIKYILGSDLQSGYVAKNFSVGIVVNELNHSTGNSNSGYRPHSSYGGGGMRGMHGMGGGRNFNSNNNSASKPEENWYQFRLVYKKT